MDPLYFFDLAKSLTRNARGELAEASYRGACGRAYYAVFGLARDLLMATDHKLPRDGTAHREVIELLKTKSSSLEVQSVGSALDALHVTRKSADYEMGKIPLRGQPFDSRRANVALAQATVMIATLQEQFKNDKRLGIP